MREANEFKTDIRIWSVPILAWAGWFLGICLLYWKCVQGWKMNKSNINEQETCFFPSFYSTQIASACFSKLWEMKMCDVKVARLSDISNVAWQSIIYSGVVLWGFSLTLNYHFQTSWHRIVFNKRYFRKIIPIILLWKNQLKCSFNVLIHHFPLLKMSQDSIIITAWLHLDSILPVSLFCFPIMFPVQAMQLMGWRP